MRIIIKLLTAALLVIFVIGCETNKSKPVQYKRNNGTGYGYEEIYKGEDVWMIRFLGSIRELPLRRLSLYRAAEFGKENGFTHLLILSDDEYKKFANIAELRDSLVADRHSGEVHVKPGSEYNLDRAFERAEPIYVRYAKNVDCTLVECAPDNEVPMSSICSSSDVAASIKTYCEKLVDQNSKDAPPQDDLIKVKSYCRNTLIRICSNYRFTKDDWIDELPDQYYPIQKVLEHYNVLIHMIEKKDLTNKVKR